jgi:uncharacterized membrane protein YoaK (UPF0700 family)
MAVQQSAAAAFPREEALPIAAMLAFAGGFLDAYTWIVHSAFANAQTANLVFLWVYMTSGEWGKALHYVPPLFAFVLGIITASALRRIAPHKAAEISILTEIVFLFIVAILHNHLPDLAGTLGISFVAALQTASFPRVEGLAYSSVMATNNFRQMIEGLFAAFAGTPSPDRFHRPSLFGVMCVAFGIGAAVGAVVTKHVPAYSLAIPVIILTVVLFRCVRGALVATA